MEPSSVSVQPIPSTSNQVQVVALLACYIGIGAYFSWAKPTDLDGPFAHTYVTCLAAYFVMAGLLVLTLTARRLDLFDPIVLVSLLYISIFAVAPMRDLIIQNYYLFGVNLFGYGRNGTLLALAGFIALYAAYLRRGLSLSSIDPQTTTPTEYSRDRVVRYCLFIWALSFAMALFNAISGGQSITYVLTLGFFGASDTAVRIDAPLGFAGAMAHSLIPTSVIYGHYARSKATNVLLQTITVGLLASQGFRYIVVIYVLAHAYVWFLKRGRAPRLDTLLILFASLALFVGAMGFYRNALKSGGTVDWSNFGMGEVSVAIFGNLEIYKTYYGVLRAVPDIVPHGLGAQMLIYTAILFIPRAFWASKPLPPVNEPITAGVSHTASISGAAYPNLGEYYFEFGVLGVIVFMYALGEALSWLYRRYRFSNDFFDLVLYSVITTGMFQVVIRGYTPSNVYMLLLMILPISIIRRVCRASPASQLSSLRSE